MNCRDIQKLVETPQGAFSLSPEAQSHVARCAGCARAVKAARVQRLLFKAVATARTPEPLLGFEGRVLAKAKMPQAAANGSTATVVGKLAWRLMPALAVVIVALFLLSRDAELPTQNGLTTLVTPGGALDDGWGSEMAQMFGAEQFGGGTQ
jgi:hypothetical protein